MTRVARESHSTYNSFPSLGRNVGYTNEKQCFVVNEGASSQSVQCIVATPMVPKPPPTPPEGSWMWGLFVWIGGALEDPLVNLWGHFWAPWWPYRGNVWRAGGLAKSLASLYRLLDFGRPMGVWGPRGRQCVDEEGPKAG